MRKLIWGTVAACLLGCAEIEDDATIDQDSLTVIPIGPGTAPDAVVPPDTPRSPQEGAETAADTTPRRY
jgi:hypothetical protein